jgi:hypothetical protein
LPRVEALHHPVARIRANPWLAVGIAAAALLAAAWLGWAIYVASDRGVNEGLGVLIAVPALLIGLAIVSLPFIGGYLLVKRLHPASSEELGAEDAERPEDEKSAEEEESADEEPAEEEETEPEAAAS